METHETLHFWVMLKKMLCFHRLKYLPKNLVAEWGSCVISTVSEGVPRLKEFPVGYPSKVFMRVGLVKCLR